MPGVLLSMGEPRYRARVKLMVGWRSALALAAVLVACGEDAPAPAPSASAPPPINSTPPEADPTAPLWNGVIVPYPGARKLCSGSIPGFPTIVYDSYATDDHIQRVLAFYRIHHASTPLEVFPAGGFTMRAALGNVLAAHPRGVDYPSCGVEPGASDQALIVRSHPVIPSSPMPASSL